MATKFNLKKIFRKTKSFVVSIVSNIKYLGTFIFFLIAYTTTESIRWLDKRAILPLFMKKALHKTLQKPYSFIRKSSQQPNGINHISLIKLAFKSMSHKRSRTLIATAGMSCGIGIIVFLLSIGYGLERLVISRIAQLDELRQVEVMSQPGNPMVLNDDVLADLTEISNVEAAMPIVSAVAHINFKDSQTDIAVYGVTSDYLINSAIKTVEGDFFSNNDIVTQVQSDPNYNDNQDEPDQAISSHPNIMLAAILGTSDKNIDDIEIVEEGNTWVELGLIDPSEKLTNITSVTFDSSAQFVAVVNRAMLSVLNIPENEAVGTTFRTNFVITSDLLEENTKIVSSSENYTIVGVIPDDRTPFFYVPFIDIRGLGVNTFSQAKVIANNQDTLDKIRQHIEVMGFTTNSVVDTIDQISKLFKTVRTLFAFVGLVALIVAALGMFNTLTVSLLERTREIGIMKSMGMKADEVKELFLTESMLMSFYGGVGGIVLGLISGKLLGIIISIFAISQGEGFINVSYVPTIFTVLILILSLLVGLTTGMYPAHRATKISAMDALRYE